MITINTALWAWPQYTMIGMMAFSLFVSCSLNGMSQSGKHSAAVKFIDTAILVFVLVAGGFFS